MTRTGIRLQVHDDGAPKLIQYFALCGVHTLSTYNACDLRCSYCITSAQGVSEPRVRASLVSDAITRDLAQIPPDVTISVGGLIDAYPHVEETEGVTREAIAALVRAGRSLSIVTKGPTVVRDADLLRDADATVCVSLSSLDDDALRRLEPHVAPASRRMQVIEELLAEGVKVQLHAQPWIPGLTDAEQMIEWADARFPIWFTPLSVQSPALKHSALARQFTQVELNAAYLAAGDRLGARPLVQWQRPLWIGTQQEDLPEPEETEGLTESEQRNVRTIRRLLSAFESGAQLELLHELWSPYMQIHDRTGRGGPSGHPNSGANADLLFLLHGLLGDSSLEVRSITASGSEVSLNVGVSGRHEVEVLGFEASDRRVSVDLELTLDFDAQGLILDSYQDADLTPLAS